MRCGWKFKLLFGKIGKEKIIKWYLLYRNRENVEFLE